MEDDEPSEVDDDDDGVAMFLHLRIIWCFHISTILQLLHMLSHICIIYLRFVMKKTVQLGFDSFVWTIIRDVLDRFFFYCFTLSSHVHAKCSKADVHCQTALQSLGKIEN